MEKKTFNSRKGQRTNQKYRNLVGSDQQMQRLEETELRKADRTVGVNCNMFTPTVRSAFLSSVYSWKVGTLLLFLILLLLDLISSRLVS